MKVKEEKKDAIGEGCHSICFVRMAHHQAANKDRLSCMQEDTITAWREGVCRTCSLYSSVVCAHRCNVYLEDLLKLACMAAMVYLFHSSDNFIQHLETKYKKQQRCSILRILLGYLCSTYGHELSS